jgi:hypothetical protein
MTNRPPRGDIARAAELATVVTETISTDGPLIKVERFRITDAGRRAIEG